MVFNALVLFFKDGEANFKIRTTMASPVLVDSPDPPASSTPFPLPGQRPPRPPPQAPPPATRTLTAVHNRPRRARAWAFTANNYTAAHCAYLRDVLAGHAALRYLVVGKEVGGALQTPHLQGFIFFAEACTLDVASDRLCSKGAHKRPHLEIARCSALINRTYATKDSLWLEVGACPTGSRGGVANPNDPSKKTPGKLSVAISGFQDDVKAGKNMDHMWETHLEVLVRYRGGLLDYYNHALEKKKRPPPEVFILWGATGTGKSHWVEESFPRETTSVYWTTCAGQKLWCGGYTCQKVFILDDFEPRNMDAQFFKLLVDKYSCRVEPKGSQVPFLSSIIVLTSNHDPKTWYRRHDIPNAEEDVNWLAVQRRVNAATVMHFKKVYDANDNAWSCGFLPHRLAPSPLGSRAVSPTLVDDFIQSPPGSDSQECPPAGAQGRWVSESPPRRMVFRPIAPSPPAVTNANPRVRFRIPSPDEVADDDDDEEELEEGQEKPRKRRRLRPVSLSRCRFVDREAGCDDDDDDDDDEDEFDDDMGDFIED